VRVLRLAADALVSVLLAPTCPVCNAVLAEPLSGAVCRNCWSAILPITPPICVACGDPLSRSVESRIPHSQSPESCRRCRGRERVIERARAVGEYDGALREIIHALKYGGRRSLAAPLAALMRSCGRDILQDADCIAPVPLHRRRERQRGFNQARELARHCGLPVIEPLIRSRQTRPQVELAADRRHANVQGAFALRRRWFRGPMELEGRNVVLVDDVSTTGATLESCAVALKAAGVRNVFALTAARVVTRREHGT
jgi:ComF family protein